MTIDLKAPWVGYSIIGMISVATATSIIQGCNGTETVLTEPGSYTLQVSHDDKRHVTCWRFENHDGISCLPDRAFEDPKGISETRCCTSRQAIGDS